MRYCSETLKPRLNLLQQEEEPNCQENRHHRGNNLVIVYRLKLEQEEAKVTEASICGEVHQTANSSLSLSLSLYSRTLGVKRPIRPSISTFTRARRRSRRTCPSVRHKWGSEEFRVVSGNVRILAIKSPNLTSRFPRLAIKDSTHCFLSIFGSFGAHAIMDGQARTGE